MGKAGRNEIASATASSPTSRIFTASNMVAFVLLGFATFRQRRAALQLFLPAVILVGAVVIAGNLYLFKRPPAAHGHGIDGNGRFPWRCAATGRGFRRFWAKACLRYSAMATSQS